MQGGIVEVQALGERKLTAGQQIVYNNNGEFLLMQDQDIAGLTAWRQGQLVFYNRRCET